MLLDVLLAPALGAVDDDQPPPDRERHRRERPGGPLRRRAVALQHLRAAVGLGELVQPRAPLPDCAVVVAVDQIGGLELGHAADSRRQRGAARAPLSPQRTTRLTSFPGTTISLTSSLPSRCAITFGAPRQRSLSWSGVASALACTRSRTLPLT